MKAILSYALAAAVIITGLSMFLFKVQGANQATTISVDCGNAVDVKSMVGFLHFKDSSGLTNDMRKLSPKFWRVGWGWAIASKSNMPDPLDILKDQRISPILVLSDFYQYPDSGKRKNWQLPTRKQPEFLGFVQTFYKRFGNNVIYDIWNEPNHEHFWPEGSEDAFFHTFKLAHDKIRAMPGGRNAIISGPSIDKFDKAYLQRFLDFCVKNKIKLDILSWHDFREGNKLLKLEDDLKWVRQNWIDTKYKSLGIQDIHINEIIGEQDQYSPATALTYFKVLENGRADGACKACWNDSKGVSNCTNNSLDGLIDENGKPRAIWWAYKYYAESINRRLLSTADSRDLVSFAYLGDKNGKEINVLFTNYNSREQTISLNLQRLNKVKNFKKAQSVTAVCYEIPATGEAVLKQPVQLWKKKLSVLNNSLKVDIKENKNNAVYIVKFYNAG